MKKTRTQTIFIEVASGSTVDVVQEGEITLDESYKTVIGIWVKPDVAGGTSRFDIQLRDGNGKLDREPSDSKLWGAEPYVKPEEMFVPVIYNIASNRKMKVGVIPRGANTNADVQVEAVFLLSSELIKID